jgi:hypothetical protein
MTTEEIKNILLRAIDQYDGDDLERAQAAFRGHDLSTSYGFQGKTKAEIIAEYQRHRDKCNEVRAWVRSK